MVHVSSKAVFLQTRHVGTLVMGAIEGCVDCSKGKRKLEHTVYWPLVWDIIKPRNTQLRLIFWAGSDF